MTIELIRDYEVAPGRLKPKGTRLEMTRKGAFLLILQGVARDPNKIIINKQKKHGNSKRT
jgi:hypothetical protein